MKPGECGVGPRRHARKTDLSRVGPPAAPVTVPGKTGVLDRSARRGPPQALAQRLIERQEFRESRHGGKVEAGQSQFRMANTAGGAGMRVRKLRGRQCEAVAGCKAERIRGKFSAVAALFPAQPALHPGQDELGKIGCQPGLHIDQAYIGCGRAQAGAFQFKPYAQRPQSARQLQWRWYPCLRECKVGIAELRIEFSVPHLHFADITAGKLAAHGNRGGDVCRWDRGQTEAKDVAIAIQAKIYFVEP